MWLAKAGSECGRKWFLFFSSISLSALENSWGILEFTTRPCFPLEQQTNFNVCGNKHEFRLPRRRKCQGGIQNNPPGRSIGECGCSFIDLPWLFFFAKSQRRAPQLRVLLYHQQRRVKIDLLR